MTAAQIVVAAALTRADGRILVQQRRAGARHGGLWEFPGGKPEPGESLTSALARELAEELGIVVDPSDCLPLAFSSVDPPAAGACATLLLLLYRVGHWAGEPACLAADRLAWVSPDALHTLDMPPADIPLVAALAGPASSGI